MYLSEPDYDIAVTFAGEDREYVELVVTGVKAAGYSVFYDEDNSAELWGEELTEFFPLIYEQRARFAVMFISNAYAVKPWTRLERRSVLLRAMDQEEAYLLPVRLDSTPLPGLRSTIGYLDGIRFGPQGVVDAIKTKLGAPNSTGRRLFNGRTPRTQNELVVVLGERPRGWEYLVLAYFLAEGIAQNRQRFDDHRLSFAMPDRYLANAEVLSFASQELAVMKHLVEGFERLLKGPALEDAVGKPGEPGDPDKIEALAGRLTRIYVELLDWAMRLRSAATESSSASAYLRALADYANQPIEAMRDFVATFQASIDAMTARLDAGESISASMIIKFEIPDGVGRALRKARKKLAVQLRSK